MQHFGGAADGLSDAWHAHRRRVRVSLIREERHGCLHAISAQVISNCAAKSSRTANKQVSFVARSDWKNERFSRAATRAVVVHNGMALA